MKVNELSEFETPEYRLTHFDSECLSNAELLQIITGSRDMETTNRLLSEISSLGELQVASIGELEKIEGITKKMACKLVAATELGKRLSAQKKYERTKFSSPEDIANLVMEDMRHETKEFFKILLLNTRNELMKIETISIGNITSSIVDPRDVFKPVVKHGAASIVLIHNHPSGNPEPSEADLLVTNRLCKAGELLEVKVLDHLIIGDKNFVSFRKRKLIDSVGRVGGMSFSEKTKNTIERDER